MTGRQRVTAAGVRVQLQVVMLVMACVTLWMLNSSRKGLHLPAAEHTTAGQ